MAAASDLAPILGKQENARFTFGSSGQLSRQITNGAPYDIFLSANRRFAEQVVAAGKADAAALRAYATGRLAIWSKSGRYRQLEDLQDPAIRHIGMANPAHAPYGQAAREALERLGLWEKLRSKLVYAESVRQTLQFAESGNVEVILTSWTLVYERGGVLVPESFHEPLVQVAVPLRGSAEGRKFMDWLLGPEGQKLLRASGLYPPPASRDRLNRK